MCNHDYVLYFYVWNCVLLYIIVFLWLRVYYKSNITTIFLSSGNHSWHFYSKFNFFLSFFSVCYGLKLYNECLWWRKCNSKRAFWFLRCAGWDACGCSLNLFVHNQATSPFNHTAVVLRIFGPSITACKICPDYSVHRLSERPQEWSPSEWGCEIQKGFHSAAECTLTRLLSNPRHGTRVTECHMTVMGRRGVEYRGTGTYRTRKKDNSDWSND